MNGFFSSIFEFGGLFPFYNTDLGDHLRGFDVTCTDYIGTPYYTYIGLLMLFLTTFFYALQYHIIDSPKFNRVYHWWLTAVAIVVLNFMTGFIIAFNSVQPGMFCKTLKIATGDLIGLGFADALVAFLFFVLISTIPWIRQLGTNCRFTTFWKP